MTILAIEDKLDTADALAVTLKEVFPQETVVAFGSALSALHYASEHSEEIALVFTAIVLRRADGLEIAADGFEIAKALRKVSPGVELFFIVQSESGELAEIAKQHGHGTCLTRPITAETIRQATGFLQEPCPWEDKFCEEVCLWKWCERKKNSSLRR